MSPRRDPLARLGLMLAVARYAVFWERLWPCLWPAAGVVGVFVGMALLDLLPMLPFWLHALALVGFAGALGYALRGVAPALAPIDLATARHRLERDSDLDHRPLAALDDRPVLETEDPTARAVWQAHLLRVAALMGRLRVAAPAPGLARRDPYALRLAVVMFLFVALAAAGGRAGERLARAPSRNTGASPV